MKKKLLNVGLTHYEVQAAFEACSNYTPAFRKPWKQHAQTRVVEKLAKVNRAYTRLLEEAENAPD